MKFALLNVDDDASRLAAALVAAGHELTLVYRPGEAEAALRTLAPDVRVVAEWEEAMVCGADAVIVGTSGEEPRRLEQLQRLMQEGVPTVAIHPQSTSVLAYYELDMYRQATNIALVAFEPTRHQPAIAMLDVLGDVSEATIEHRSAARSRAEVLRSFVRDLGAIRRVVGQCEKVSAVGELPTAGDCRLSVQITTHGGALVRWSIGPPIDGESATWRVVGERDSAVLRPAGDDALSIDFVRDGKSETTTFAPEAAREEAADAVITALGDPQNSLWREALADLELVEAVERSLRKNRTVELFHEQASEHGTFKGMMAAGGCFLILASIALAIVVTIVGRFRLPFANLWPYALVAVLGAFLTLQLLKFVFVRRRNDRSP